MCVVHSATEEDPSLEQAFIAELDRMHATNSFSVERIRHMTKQRPEMPKPYEVLGLVLWEDAGDDEDKMTEALRELEKALELYTKNGIDPQELKVLEGDIFEARGMILIERGHHASAVSVLQRAQRLFSEANETRERKIPLRKLGLLITSIKQQLD